MNDGGERKPGTRTMGGPVARVEHGVYGLHTSLVVGVQPGSDEAASDEPQGALIFVKTVPFAWHRHFRSLTVTSGGFSKMYCARRQCVV